MGNLLRCGFKNYDEVISYKEGVYDSEIMLQPAFSNIIIVGTPQSGKSTVLFRFKELSELSFNQNTAETSKIFVNHCSFGFKKKKFNLWDTPSVLALQRFAIEALSNSKLALIVFVVSLNAGYNELNSYKALLMDCLNMSCLNEPMVLLLINVNENFFDAKDDLTERGSDMFLEIFLTLDINLLQQRYQHRFNWIIDNVKTGKIDAYLSQLIDKT